jgi:GT2 family glycosyltransferase
VSEVAVVVPVRNGRRTLPQCLEGLLRQSLRPQVIYVVDNGSTDGTHEWLQEFAVREPSLRVLREARRGPAAARNAGIRAAMAEGAPEFIAFTDADCVAEPSWLERLREGFEDDRVGAVTGRIRPRVEDTWVGRYLQITAFDPGTKDRVASSVDLAEGIAGGNACVRTCALEEVGPFDESFLVAQDWDLGLRLLKAGWWIRYASGAVVDHIHWERTAGDLLRLAAKYGCGRPRILARHFSGQISVWGFGRRVRVHGPVTASVLLSSPEKVVGALCAVALSRPWALGLAVLYAAYLGVRIWSAGRRRAVRGLRLWEVPAMVALQVAEATVGNGQAFRVGLRGRVLCL